MINYVKYPSTRVKGFEQEIFRGYQAISEELSLHLANGRQVVTVDCSDGVLVEEIKTGLASLNFDLIIDSQDIFISPEAMQAKVHRYLGDDRVFAIAYTGQWLDFVDHDLLLAAQQSVAAANGHVLIIGVGAGYIHPGSVQILADMTIWELQMRYRKDHMANFNAMNHNEETGKKFKRGYFLDWRLANFRKQQVLKTFTYYLDTVVKNDPRMITRAAFDGGLHQLLTQPFRTVPFFDEGLWGGTWMKEQLGVDDPELTNTAWGYNCLFPENEVNLTFGDTTINVPGYTLCRKYPKQLIGEKGYARFGVDYPIRFDFLDTMNGGYLSLQVHPDTRYYQDNFAMPFTQDESYYFLDCAPNDTYMYLGLTDEADKDSMERDLLRANAGEIDFPAEKYSNKIPVKKHEHYHIPAGTVHCSGENTMVLEISSAPCIFTFKLWDWGRVGMDGKPRPINVERGMEVVQWDKKKAWMEATCAFKPILIASGDGWREEKTGMHDYQFIETRRIWQTKACTQYTNHETHVLNLVQGKVAIISSPSNAFEPYEMHFAESVVIPALVDAYTITPVTEEEIGVIKAYVRF
jgi:mannose-6-phosphate isomerase class I